MMSPGKPSKPEHRVARSARYARGRVLDGFSYHGGFALRLGEKRHRTDLGTKVKSDATLIRVELPGQQRIEPRLERAHLYVSAKICASVAPSR